MNYMNFSLDNFINSSNIGTDKTLQIRNKSGVLKYTLNPFQINTYYVNNNIIKIHFKSSDDIIELDFRTPLEAKEALKKLQQELDKFKDVVPNGIYEDIQNYVDDRISSSTYSSGSGDNIYNSDGQIESNRVVDLYNKELLFTSTYSSSFQLALNRDISGLTISYLRAGEIDDIINDSNQGYILVSRQNVNNPIVQIGVGSFTDNDYIDGYVYLEKSDGVSLLNMHSTSIHAASKSMILSGIESMYLNASATFSIADRPVENTASIIYGKNSESNVVEIEKNSLGIYNQTIGLTAIDLGTITGEETLSLSQTSSSSAYQISIDQLRYLFTDTPYSNGIIFVTQSRDFEANDEGKLLVMADDNDIPVILTMPASPQIFQGGKLYMVFLTPGGFQATSTSNVIYPWYKNGNVNSDNIQGQFLSFTTYFDNQLPTNGIAEISSTDGYIIDPLDSNKSISIINYLMRSSSDSIITKTVGEINSLISSSGLLPGRTYKITGVHTNLYDDGTTSGTTIFLKALTINRLSSKGQGIFYNPRYSDIQVWDNLSELILTLDSGVFNTNEAITSDNGATGYLFTSFGRDTFIPINGDWTTSTTITGYNSGASATIVQMTLKSYNVDDAVAWGGYVWRNLNGNLGKKSAFFQLNNEWEKVQYSNSIVYDTVLDDIEYDYINGMIIMRKDTSGNEVHANKSDVDFLENNYGFINPILVFMWGRPYNYNNDIGISNNIVKNGGYFECVDFKNGKIVNNIVDNSYFYNNIFSGANLDNFLLYDNYFNNTNVANNISDAGSSIHNNTLISSSLTNNTLLGSTLYNNMINTSTYAYNFMASSNFYHNTLESVSSLSGNTMIDVSIDGNKLINYSSISNTIFNLMSVNSNFFNKTTIEIFGTTISVGDIRNITGEGGRIEDDITSATIIYGNYAKTLYLRPDGESRFRYYNSNDVLVIAFTTD